MKTIIQKWLNWFAKDPHAALECIQQTHSNTQNAYQALQLLYTGHFAQAQSYLHPLLLTFPRSEWIHALWKLSWIAPSQREFMLEDAFYALLPKLDADEFSEYLPYPQLEVQVQPKDSLMMASNLNTANIDQNFYGQVLLTPTTLANVATSYENWMQILMFHKFLATDVYVKYLDQFYRQCLDRYGSNWHYFDITNVVYAAAKMSQPKRYLEIGVRRGRTLCCAVEGSPKVDIYAFDMWMQNYAGMENPGPDFVAQELQKHGHQGQVQFVNGNSHQTLPAFFGAHPELLFDMITVDGDHSAQGAYQDLMDVIPKLALGGILIFDDICHPQHMYLLDVWKDVMSKHPELSDFCYTEAGYGVAFAIKMK